MFQRLLELFRKVHKDRKTKSGQWRKAPPFTIEDLERLKENIGNFSPPPSLNLSKARIVMIGMTGSGKSSIYNTINSIFSDRITQKAICGSTDISLTTKYREYLVRSSTGTTLNFCLCDTCGMGSRCLEQTELEYLLEGNVPNGYEFKPASPITPKVSGFIKRPNLGDKVHCVVFVIDVTTIETAPTWFWERLRMLQVRMNTEGIPRVVFLTKIDQISTKIADDVSKVFLCSEFHQMVTKVAERLGVPENNVLPIKNYHKETNLDTKTSILVLTALDQVLGFASDFFVGQLDAMEKNGRHEIDHAMFFVIAVCFIFITIAGYYAWGKSLS